MLILIETIFLETRGLLDTKLIEFLAARYKSVLEEFSIAYTLPAIDLAPSWHDITYSAMLAHYGMLKNLNGFTLRNAGDLNSVPTKHLSSLVSIVTMGIDIHSNVGNVSRKSLVTIFDSAKCNLSIRSQNLGREETEALVRAIETRVERVRLGYPDVTIDISTLTSYDGFLDRYRGKVRTLAKSRKWKVIKRSDNVLIIYKKKT